MKNVSLMMLGIAAALLVGGPLDAAERVPNFVIIFTDDQGYADVNCFGAEDLATPNLDRMTAEGVRLTDFHVQASVCSPSRASLLTGVYPKRAGITGVLSPRKHTHGLRKDRPTIAEVLRPLNYATMCVGKWHVGHTTEHLPTKRGFDEYLGIPYSNDMGAMNGKGGIDIHRDFPPLPLMKDDEVLEEEPDQAGLTRRYTEAAVSFIDRHRDQPFFLYFPHTFPHRPWFASNAFQGKSKRGLYGDMIEEIDWSVGQVLDALKRNSIDEHTLVIFSSDNGPAPKIEEDGSQPGGSAVPLRGQKFSIYEGGHRVPCIARWPNRIPPGVVCDELATAMDLMPTFAKLAQATTPDVDGYDIWPLLSQSENARSPHDHLFHYSGGRIGAIRRGAWKLILPSGKTHPVPELYDLSSDISESKNLAERHPELVKELAELTTQSKPAEKVSAPDGAKHPKGRSGHRGQTPFPQPDLPLRKWN